MSGKPPHKDDQPTVPSSVAPARPVEHHTEEMALRYLAQGLPDRAAEILRTLLGLEPNNVELQRHLERAEAALVAARAAVAQRRFHPAVGEPFGMLDLEELPEAYGVDECELIARDPGSLFAYWEVTDGGMAMARGHLGDEAHTARLVLRLFLVAVEHGGGRETRDHGLEHHRGRRYLPAPRPGLRVRAAVGLVSDSGLFAPIAHSSTVRIPPAEPAPFDPAAVAWIEVEPSRTAGREKEPIKIVRGPVGGAAHSERGPSSGGAGEPGAGPGFPSSPWRWRPGSSS